jgi:predicted nucleic acid-binding protein
MKNAKMSALAPSHNDIWIAAHALESGSELLSLDRHFDAVQGLPWTHIAS